MAFVGAVDVAMQLIRRARAPQRLIDLARRNVEDVPRAVLRGVGGACILGGKLHSAAPEN